MFDLRGVSFLLVLAACAAPEPPRDDVEQAYAFEIVEDGARIRVSFEHADPRAVADADELQEWVSRSAHAVAAFLGRFPVRNVDLVLTESAEPGLRDGHAEAVAADHAVITIAIGPRTESRHFRDDWILTHEMIHLALPTLPRRHRWLEEGSATYLEPIVRARAGIVDEDSVWREWTRDYGQGLPTATDRGLDFDPSWGRTYYGGASFCLLADAEIRARTQNRRSLRDVFASIVAEGGEISDRWPLERVLEIGDRATGTTVLTELHARQGDAPEPRELDSLWRKLGVHNERGRMRYDDEAPWAAVRRALVLDR